MVDQQIESKLDVLIQKFYEGQLGNEDAEALLELLQDYEIDNAAINAIQDQYKVHYLFGRLSPEIQQAPQTKEKTIRNLGHYRLKPIIFGTSVCILLIFVFTAFFRRERDLPNVVEIQLNIAKADPIVESMPNGEKATSVVALLQTTSHVVWSKDNQIEAAAGDLLPAGWIKFDEGIVSIQFFSGACIVVEGPAKLELISPMKVYCTQGRITAEVPKQAIGFRIDVPQMDVVDLGTSFNIEVSENKSVVHVIEGEVEIQRFSKEKTALKKGENAEVDDYGNLERTIGGNAGYVTWSDIEATRKVEDQKKYLQWKEQGMRLDRDPALLVRFDFEKENLSGYSVFNTAEMGKDQIHDGLMIGCELSKGMWDGKGAIQFKRMADRFRFDIPGEFSAVTFASWIRVDSVERLYNSLFTTDGFSPGEIHWHLLSNGKIELGVNYDHEKPGFQLWSETAITSEMFGKWIHLAAVVDNINREVLLYLNGVVIGHAKLTMDMPIRLKNGQLGNWTVDPAWDVPVHPIRFFCGVIGEFLFFSRALSSDEIIRLYHGTYHPNN